MVNITLVLHILACWIIQRHFPLRSCLAYQSEGTTLDDSYLFYPLHLFTGTGLKKASSYRSINTELSDKIENITDLLAIESKPKRSAGRNNHNNNRAEKQKTAGDKLMDV